MRDRTTPAATLARIVLTCVLVTTARSAAAQSGVGPVIVVETSKGTFTVETYPNEAPRTVTQRAGVSVKPNFAFTLSVSTCRSFTGGLRKLSGRLMRSREAPAMSVSHGVALKKS